MLQGAVLQLHSQAFGTGTASHPDTACTVHTSHCPHRKGVALALCRVGVLQARELASVLGASICLQPPRNSMRGSKTHSQVCKQDIPSSQSKQPALAIQRV